MKAFPIHHTSSAIDKWQGMDLRDYFAANAMPAVIENSNFIFDENDYVEIAKISYQVADAMMKAREL